MANPAIGRVEQAFQDIVTAYKGLKQSRGYRFTVKTVSRHLRELDDLTSEESPALFIFRPGGESDLMLKYIDSGASGGYRNAILIHVLGWVMDGGENPDDEKLATIGENFLSDIRRLQMRDARFGSSVIEDSTLLPGGGNDAAFDSEGTAVVQPIRIDLAWDLLGTHLP